MPLGALLEPVIQAVGELLLEGLGYQTGRVLAPACTFGRVVVAPLSPEAKDLPKRPRTKPDARVLRKLDDGRWLMSADLAVLIGLLFWICLLAGVFLLWWFL